jgi:hypothetical protein
MNVRDPLRSWGRVPAHPHPRSPAPNCDWELRDSSPGMASASMGSISLSSSDFSSFCPSSVYRESLGHSLFPGRPFCPSHPGLPCYPGILGLRAGAASRRPSSGEGWMDYPIHHPSRGGSRRTGRGPGALPPSCGRPRRGGAAPAFVGAPNSSPSAPRVLPWGLGNRDRRSWRPGLP